MDVADTDWAREVDVRTDSSFGDEVFDAFELVVRERVRCRPQEQLQARRGQQAW